jgi:hypothetical protein
VERGPRGSLYFSIAGENVTYVNRRKYYQYYEQRPHPLKWWIQPGNLDIYFHLTFSIDHETPETQDNTRQARHTLPGKSLPLEQLGRDTRRASTRHKTTYGKPTYLAAETPTLLDQLGRDTRRPATMLYPRDLTPSPTARAGIQPKRTVEISYHTTPFSQSPNLNTLHN